MVLGEATGARVGRQDFTIKGKSQVFLSVPFFFVSFSSG